MNISNMNRFITHKQSLDNTNESNSRLRDWPIFATTTNPRRFIMSYLETFATTMNPKRFITSYFLGWIGQNSGYPILIIFKLFFVFKVYKKICDKMKLGGGCWAV